jgi:hypothetical protein
MYLPYKNLVKYIVIRRRTQRYLESVFSDNDEIESAIDDENA